MNKSRNIMLIVMLTMAMCLFLTGCSLNDKIKEYSKNKIQCYLNKENVTQFSFEENNYTILEDTVSSSELGEWVGFIRKLVAIDEAGKIVIQESIESTTFQTLVDLADKAPEATHIISFLNIYEALNTDYYLIVDVNGEHHKAIINENIKDTDKIFDFKKTGQSPSGRFTINPQNATQLLCDGKVYQVTSDTVSNDKLGGYIDILAENVTFDTETKIPLSKAELSSIDWNGENAGQVREQWLYKDVYEIYGIDRMEAVAVKVNNNYQIAKQIG